MDGHTFSFPPYSYPHLSPMEDPVFQPLPYEGQFSPAIGSYTNPSLQPSPSDPYLSQWEREPPQVKRWISDDQRTALFNADPYSNVMTSVARPAMGTCPVPPPSQARLASPICCSDHGLTAPSPLAETDSFYDNNLPSTPSDTAVLSPSYHPGHLEYYTSQETAIQFHNMGPAVPPAYVKPGDVDPSQQLGYLDAETSQPEFTFADRRSYSFESGTTHNDMDANVVQNQITVALSHKRMTSPEEMQPVKRELYPPLADEDDDSVPEEMPLSKRKKDDDDDDYTPAKKIKAAGTASPRRTRAKPSPTKRTTTASSASSRQAASSSARAKSLSCQQCKHAPFKDEPTLASHIKKLHTRPFTCVFDFAGCTSTFASKNEWKRHNSTQHLVLHYWLCTDGQCGKTVNGASPASHSRHNHSQPSPRTQTGSSGTSTFFSNTFHPQAAESSASPLAGVRFNRKDLYTQHVRRMHMPPHIKKDLKALEAQKASQPASASSKSRKGGQPPAASSLLEKTKLAWEKQLKGRQEAALRDRIVLPRYMRCPAAGCGAEFKGDDAWDQRMEHVARHLDGGIRGHVRFGGPEDGTLVDWAASAEVGVIIKDGEGWVLNEAMRRGARGAGAGGVNRELVMMGEDEGDEDAEGEDDDGVQ